MRERLMQNFTELVAIDSLSLQERAMADALTGKLRELGLEAYEDQAGRQLNGTAGNLIANMPGQAAAPSFILMAHMDTQTPGLGKKAVLKDGVFYSNGDTVLGADDLGAVVVILEVIRALREEKIPHGDIQIIFTIAEEIILEGAKHLDRSAIRGDYCLVLDCGGPTGLIVVNAPDLFSFVIDITGQAAHAGIEPEKGINAISIAGRAIARMTVGRLDPETTANFGLISGGEAINTVCETVRLEGEVRSHRQGRSQQFLDELTRVFKGEAEAAGGSAAVKSTLRMSRLHVAEDAAIREYLRQAGEKIGVPVEFTRTNGGSDANIMSGYGLQTICLAFGLQDAHTTREHISLDDMEKCVRLVVETIRSTVQP